MKDPYHAGLNFLFFGGFILALLMQLSTLDWGSVSYEVTPQATPQVEVARAPKRVPVQVTSVGGISAKRPPSLEGEALSAVGWIERSISYTPDVREFWQWPKETLERKAGDCEDRALLMLWMLKERTGVRGALLIVDYGIPGELHAEVLFDGKRYLSMEREPTVIASFTYDEAFEMIEQFR